MRTTDEPGLTHDKLTVLRNRGVGAVRAGESPEAVARVPGANRVTVYGWLALYRERGWDRLVGRTRRGRKPKLSGPQLAWVYKTVTLGDTRQYRFRFALWTSPMLGELIKWRFGIRLSRASICRLLNQLGLSAQRPLWRAYQADPEKVERWLREEFPRIRALARSVNAEIWFGDEAGVRSDAHAGTAWAPRGRTPIVSSTRSRFGLNLISAVSPRGEFRFMGVAGRFNADVFFEFLRRLLHGAERPILLMVDRHSTHRPAKVTRFLEIVEGRLGLFSLPRYSPEINPHEHVWSDLNNKGIGRMALDDPDHQKREVLGHQRHLQRWLDLVRPFFKAPFRSYAA